MTTTVNTMNTTSRTCGTTRCPCFRAHRECDPELCLRCDARNSNREGGCRNSAIQHMRHKRGVIFRSRYGLGFYLSESVREGDLITEYIGDLIYEATTKSRDPIASHSRRQYMFKLNSTFTVDGGAIANVQAHVRLVNGEHRIGIFAVRDIGAGEEVFLDYGTEFFQTRKKVVVE
ncbi:hypothetical protein AGABI1DRAFT_109603 [Agaricus bisporus var. burnettii JB137-S8]|uniref:SET domain-containing protein n=1 Tax=Agaricus bisporus var. burnettii (strain JB137-S8 / ATCC MYA-4627 / FGSC 10392) TaxID=597362 RepID=K5WXD3_AGABU|nr:uncharacterized protein AGABI1DRAFT_109603 [Agaricus bisporus var. burnettii JB137-S8]EKM75237.1 hypothetical protein AGABI1DRAFT_109603 [Agaricus bisporus var. burnettii JB137-S8]